MKESLFECIVVSYCKLATRLKSSMLVGRICFNIHWLYYMNMKVTFVKGKKRFWYFKPDTI